MKNTIIPLFLLLFFVASIIGVHAVITDPLIYLNFSQTTGNLANTTTTSFTVGSGITQTNTGLVGNAYNFSTPNDRINLGNETYVDFYEINFSIAILAKYETIGNFEMIWGKNGVDSDDGVGIASSTSGPGALRIEFTGAPQGALFTPTVGQWDCFILTGVHDYDNNLVNWNFYGNGTGVPFQLTNSGAANQFDPTFSSLINLTLGGEASTVGYADYNGLIDQFAMYNRELSSGEAQAVCDSWSDGIDFMAQEPTPANPPLLRFNATSLDTGSPITNFCVTGTGTNTSFSTCTTNGTAFNNLTGTYNYTANATGFFNQTVTNYVFSQNSTIQFNLSAIPAPAPLLTFNATNLDTGAPLTTFCVSGTGTNTSFTRCTTNGTAYVNTTGTYNFTANATGFFNQTVTNYAFTANATIQFNLTTIPAIPPLISFNVTNASSGAPINTFCIRGTGTNTTFLSCTTNGTIFNNLSGTYNYTANATGFNNQTVSNFLFNSNTTITFNLTTSNVAPIVNSVTLTATADNLTLLFTGNISDGNDDPVNFIWVLYQDNNSVDSGTDGPFNPNMARQWSNATGSNGTFILQLQGSDGLLTGTAVNSTPLIITISPASPAPTQDLSTFGSMVLAVLIIILIAILILLHLLPLSLSDHITKVLDIILLVFIAILAIAYLLGVV